MKKRILSLTLVLILALSLFPASVFAALPQGYWPVWSAYAEAVEKGADDTTLLQKGDAVISFYSKYDRNAEIANQLFVVYRDRLNRLIYENRQDWDNAIVNTKALDEICRYQISIGNTPEAYAEWLPRCAAHLAVLQPFAGVYAASYTQNKTYGSAVAPASGTLYGSIFDGSYGEAGICSFYVELESETAKQFDYLIDPMADGQRAILINLNFRGEGSTARAIPSGVYDASLRETLLYLATLSSPVLLRIGGEMDVWMDAVTPADYIAAYQHVAALARALAPKAELVWSPNFVSGWYTNTADYYPGDSVVDWVGVSLYYNYNANGSDNSATWVEYTHAKQFADPVTVGEKVFAIAKARNKPAIVTEGGVHRSNGEAYAAAQVAKEFSTLTMVYPQVKAIVYFDKAINGNDYRLTGSVKAAADAAVAANPTLIPSGSSTAATYVPIETLNERMSGTLVLAATGHTYLSADMSAVWKLDGQQTASASGSPNQYRIDLSTLAAGAHKLEITLSDGQKTTVSKTYTLDYTNGTVKITAGYTAPATPVTPPAPAANVAYESTQTVALDGKQITLPAYALKNASGNSTNYVRLRDLAQLLNGSAAQFDVTWDGAAGAINVANKHSYDHPNGTEGSVPFSGNQPYQKFTGATLVDGSASGLDAFTITYGGSGHTYYQLRDLGRTLGFNVGWTAERGMFIETDKPYTDAD